VKVWLATVSRLLPVVVGAIVLSILGLCVVRGLVPNELLRASNDEVGNYLQTLGTVYAVLLAFVVYVVWMQFDGVRTQVEREVNDIIDVYRTADGFPDAIRDDIHESLRRYVDAVLADEWRAMSRSDEATIERVGRLLDHVWRSMHAFCPERECHLTLYGEALQRMNELSDVRAARLSGARARIPLALRLLMYSGAVVMVASLYLLAVDRFVIHAIISAALAGAVAHVIYVVLDLDDAFGGAWQVSREPFERARRFIACARTAERSHDQAADARDASAGTAAPRRLGA